MQKAAAVAVKAAAAALKTAAAAALEHRYDELKEKQAKFGKLKGEESKEFHVIRNRNRRNEGTAEQREARLKQGREYDSKRTRKGRHSVDYRALIR